MTTKYNIDESLRAIGAFKHSQTMIALHAASFEEVANLVQEKASLLKGKPYSVSRCEINKGDDGLWHGVIYLN